MKIKASVLILMIVACAGFEVPVTRHKRTDRNQTLRVGDFNKVVFDNFDYFYLGEFPLGDGSYNGLFQMDTGSSALWNGVTGCTGC